MKIFIRKRRNKYIVCLDYRDENGRRKQKQLKSFEKEKQAVKYMTLEQSKIYEDMYVLPEKTTVDAYLCKWLELRKNNLAITTYARYKGIIETDIHKGIGDIELQKITPLKIQSFYNELSQRLSQKTILQYHRILHKAFEDAKIYQSLVKNPCEFVEVPKPKKFKAKCLTLHESRQLLESVKNTRLEIPVNLAVGLGLRSSEILGLSWDRVDFVKNTITIDRTVARDRITHEWVFKDPKTENSSRVLTAPISLMRTLKECRMKQLEDLDTPNPYNLVFTKVNGEPMVSDSFSRMFKDFLKRKGLPIVRFHDLRHTNASIMLLSKTPLKVASARLGHSSVAITGDLYTHVLEELETSTAHSIESTLYSFGQQSGQQSGQQMVNNIGILKNMK